MKTDILIEFANDLLSKKIALYENKGGSKWYLKDYVLSQTIEPEKTYGVCFDGIIHFEFKTGKNEDSFLKSFFNQYVSKYATKEPILIDGEFRTQTKEEILNHFRRFGDRVFKSFYYTTHYGIGMFALFFGDKTIEEKTRDLRDYLKSKGVKWYNEYSEAGWAYRFVINQNVDIHNNLLESFKD